MKPFLSFCIFSFLVNSPTVDAKFFDAPVALSCISTKSENGQWPMIDVKVENNCATCKHITLDIFKNGQLSGMGATFKNVKSAESRLYSYDASSPGVYKPVISKVDECASPAPKPIPKPPSPPPANPTFCPGPTSRIDKWPVKVAGRTSESRVDNYYGATLCVSRVNAPNLGRLICLGKLDTHPDSSQQEHWQCASDQPCGDLYWGQVYPVNLKDTSDGVDKPYWCVQVSDESQKRANRARFYVLDK